ncbi:MAG: creatininase family protein [Opitutaceae bacterium]|jgi:creatinine amidohydrolase|nr:creatininase family protein [Opitutaceae bacterium]
MSMTWLADADFDTAWAHRAWSDFDAFPDKRRALVILPVHGFADHGLGLPLDAEEAAGGAILRRAVAKAGAVLPLVVLPPLRFGLAPYPHTHFGLDPDDAHALIREVSDGVRDAGFTRLVFFCTSPWNRELVNAAATDLRAGPGLQAFVINLAEPGPDFHPGAGAGRADAQAIAAHVLGVAPDTGGARPADVRDPAFRPGEFRQPAPLPPPVLAPDPVALIDSAARQLARLLAEIDAHPPLGAGLSIEAGAAPGGGSLPGAGLSREADLSPGAAASREAGLSSGVVASHEAGLSSGVVSPHEAGLSHAVNPSHGVALAPGTGPRAGVAPASAAAPLPGVGVAPGTGLRADAAPPLGAGLHVAVRRAPVMLPRLPANFPVSTAKNVFAAPYREHYLPALTQARLDALPGKARALVIIPTGAIEQHGRHLPVGVDAILGQAWLNHALPKLAPAAAARVWVAPPVTYGKSNEHAGFPGTVSLTARTLRRLLLALAAHVRGLGFRHLAVLNTHGGNSPVVVYTLREIQTVLGLRAGMLGLPRPAELSAQEAAHGFHAGEWETALMLACAGRLVRMDRAVREHPARVDEPGGLRPGGAPAVFAWLASDISASGVMGDATAATLKKGARWLDESSTALARRIEELLP